MKIKAYKFASWLLACFLVMGIFPDLVIASNPDYTSYPHGHNRDADDNNRDNPDIFGTGAFYTVWNLMVVAVADSQAALQSTINNAVKLGPTEITLKNDIDITGSTIIIPADANITLTGNFSLIANGDFPVVTVNDNAIFTLNGPTLTRNDLTPFCSFSYGVAVNGGTFIMNNGTISGNAAWGSGGGVSVDGTFTMNGGTISGNRSIQTSGGGVHIGGGSTFTMNGGTISDNTASWGGGGVHVLNGTFHMNGGTISDNEALNHGGGVYIWGGTFALSDGIISGNKALWGGGALITNNGTLTIEDGIISSNEAIGNGGGLYIFSSTLTINNGVISGNIAHEVGGGIYITGSDSIFTMNNGRISSNTAQNGGGIFIFPLQKANLTISDTSIFTKNYATEGAIDFGLDAGLAQFDNINWYDSNSISGTHLLNNYDINNTKGEVPVSAITFNLQEGTGGLLLQQQSVQHCGTATGLLSNLTGDGFGFSGWIFCLITRLLILRYQLL